MAENATDIIWIFNLASMTFDYVSPSIERIRGFTLDEAQKLRFEEHFSPESYQRALEILEEELALDNQEGADKNRSRTIEIQQSKKSGGYIWTEATVSFIRDESGKPIAVMGVSRDIEARKKAEIKLVESERKYRFLFENGSDLLSLHDLEGDLIETNIHYKKEYAWTQEDLVNLNIHDFLLSPEYQKIILANDNIRVNSNLDTHCLNIVGSETHIAKSIMNLVANAVDAMPAGGDVQIRTKSYYIDTEYSGSEPIPEGEYTVLEVADNGIGMSASDLERIFEPFYTKKSMGRSGTGLGMSVVWGTIKDHGGYIDIKKPFTLEVIGMAVRSELDRKK